jgi:hypothetical protein
MTPRNAPTAPAEQSGQTLVIFALVLALLLSGLTALVADLGAVFVAYNRVDDSALLAIQAGASAVDEESFYTGHLELDAPVASQRCRDSLADAGLTGTCSADTRSVTVDVTYVVKLPVQLFGLQAPVHVHRTARPAFGGRAAETTT